MFDYPSLSTAALIDLLLTEADRVTTAHLDEIVRRGDEPLPRLREILLNEDYWYEGQRGEFWIERHVVTLLSRIGEPSILPDLLGQLMTGWFADYDWLLSHWGEALAGFGAGGS